MQILTRAVAITPSDTGHLAYPCILFVGSTGNVKVDTGDDSGVIFLNVPDGTVIPLLVSRVYDTDTTASDIVGMW